MRNIIAISIRALLVFTFLTGVAYPLLITGIAQWLSPYAANGSLVKVDKKIIGSELLAQGFKRPGYFWSRPSAADYSSMPGAATNLGPTSQKLKSRVGTSLKDLGIAPESADKPYDLLLMSGSGLDPHITPESAQFQLARVANARKIEVTQLAALLEAHTETSFLGVLGRPRVNVLNLNLALDKLPR